MTVSQRTYLPAYLIRDLHICIILNYESNIFYGNRGKTNQLHTFQVWKSKKIPEKQEPPRTWSDPVDRAARVRASCHHPEGRQTARDTLGAEGRSRANGIVIREGRPRCGGRVSMGARHIVRCAANPRAIPIGLWAPFLPLQSHVALPRLIAALRTRATLVSRAGFL